MLTAASTPMPAITFSTKARSSLVCALIAEVPSQLSTGVRSQNSDIAARMKSASAPPLYAGAQRRYRAGRERHQQACPTRRARAE